MSRVNSARRLRREPNPSFPEERLKEMSWSVVPFGKYEGKTLPEIIVRDLDWFFWMAPKLYGKLGTEARDLARKARAIKIPGRYGKKLEVEYRYELDHGSKLGRRFCGFAFVKVDTYHSRWTSRLPHLDLALPISGKKYDKRAGRILIQDFRLHYFGKHKRLTKHRCEDFFSNNDNFIAV
jgi:uncharacterized protein (DUF3820 family)